MGKILIIEDDFPFFIALEMKLKNIGCSIELIYAGSLEDGQEMFLRYKDNLRVIIMDACVPGNTLNSLPLISFILKEHFFGPIIACSSRHNKEMMASGCTHQSAKDEEILAQVIVNLLK